MLEYAVRPYTSTNALGRIIIPSTPGATIERATLTWGAEADMPKKVFKQIGVEKKDDCKEELTELDRETEDVKIEQEGKPENYVMVRRSNVVTLDKKDVSGDTTESTDQTSGVEQPISDSMKEVDGAVYGPSNGDFVPLGTEKDCGVKWKLNNNTAAAA